jgi:hypothetical protein
VQFHHADQHGHWHDDIHLHNRDLADNRRPEHGDNERHRDRLHFLRSTSHHLNHAQQQLEHDEFDALAHGFDLRHKFDAIEQQLEFVVIGCDRFDLRQHLGPDRLDVWLNHAQLVFVVNHAEFEQHRQHLWLDVLNSQLVVVHYDAKLEQQHGQHLRLDGHQPLFEHYAVKL